MLRGRSLLVLVATLTLVCCGFANAAGTAVAASGVLLPRLPLAQCGASVTHRLDCSSMLLSSSTIDLDLYVGQNVKVVGTVLPAFCDVIDVTSIEPAPKTLAMCGTPATGCPIRLTLSPSDGIGSFVLMGSTAVDFTPIGVITGSLLIAPPVVFLAQGLQQSPGTILDVAIPPLPPLVGVPIYLQGAMAKIGPMGPPVLTNPLCFTILPSIVFCIDPTGC